MNSREKMLTVLHLHILIIVFYSRCLHPCILIFFVINILKVSINNSINAYQNGQKPYFLIKNVPGIVVFRKLQSDAFV